MVIVKKVSGTLLKEEEGAQYTTPVIFLVFAILAAYNIYHILKDKRVSDKFAARYLIKKTRKAALNLRYHTPTEHELLMSGMDSDADTACLQADSKKDNRYGADQKSRINETSQKKVALPPPKSMYRISIACLVTGIMLITRFVLITQTDLFLKRAENRSSFSGIIENVDSDKLNAQTLNKLIAENESYRRPDVDTYVVLAFIGGILAATGLTLTILYVKRKKKYKEAEIWNRYASHSSILEE
jgi:hypothetical protein